MFSALLEAGLSALYEYVATHTLTCLVPAFFLAGAMVTFIDRETVLDLLGSQAGKMKSFSLASVTSFFVAACSCTVIPVASGLYYSGAGIGAAFIVLWVAPATNLLAVAYTGSIIGGDMAMARVAAALLMAFFIGTVMSAAFRGEEAERTSRASASPSAGRIVGKKEAALILLLVISLLAPNYLVQGGPYILKIAVWAVASMAVAGYAMAYFEKARLLAWMRETWWFVKTIFPLLLAGVFLVGIVTAAIPEEWIRRWLGGESFGAALMATFIGSVSYFATMTEAPFVDALMKMGMGKGPALALLLTGPGLSLPNWLAIARVFGVKKALVYVPAVIFSGAVMGWIFGNFIL